MASQSQEVTLLFKKNFGVADTQDANAVSQESIASRTRVIPSQQIFSQAIPTTKPTDFVKDGTFNAANGQRYYSQANPYIIYYSSIKLGAINLYESYWYTAATLANPGANILSSAIPTTYGDGSYTVNVYDCNAVPLLAGGSYPWTFDPDGGILKFYTNLTSANAPPTVTYYRYEGTFGLTATTTSNYLTLSSGNLFVSSLNLIDATTRSTNYLTASSGGLYFNGSTLYGNYITQANLTSTIIGLGTAGYLSSATATANLPGGLVSTANLANLISTTALNTALTSTVIGLGTAGYLSSATVSAIIPGGLVSTANLATLVSTSYLASQLTSSILGLGTAGYISSSQLLSTTYGYSQNFFTLNATASTLKFSTATGGNAYISTLTIDQLIFGDGNGWADFAVLRAVAISTLQLNAGIIYAPIISTSQLVGINFLTQANLTSTVIGLGTVGYLSSASASINASGLVSTANLANLVSTANLANLVSTANLVDLVSTANLATLVSTSYLQTQLGSTVIGLGTAGYISTGQLLSTSLGLTQYMSSFIDPTELTSTVIGLGTQGFVSSFGLTYAVASTAQGLGTFGYTSTSQLLSTSLGLYQQIQTSATAIVQADVTSTVIGLGTAGYISSSQLLSTTYGYSQNFATQNESVSSLRFSTATANNAYISSLNIDQLTFGDGNGWADFGVLRALAISTLVVNTGIIYATTVSTTQIVGVNFLTQANLTSTVIGLGTVGYLSSASANINATGLVSTANLATLVSTSYFQTQLASTVIGLGTAGYLSSASANINATGLVSTANLATLVSTSYLQTQLGSTVIGLGTAGYLSSIPSVGGFVSTANLATLVSTSYLQTQLGSTVIGLGTAGYISSSALTTSITSTVIGLGTAGYISSAQLLSTTYGYSQNFITQNESVSSLRFSTAIGGNAYISSLTIDQLTFGDGNGWADFGALRAAVVSTYQVNTGILYAPIISTQLIVGVSFLTQTNLTSTVIGLGTTGYLSSIPGIGGFVSTANLTGLVSTANLAGLVSTANLAGLVSTANLANLVSTNYLASQLGSTVIGLGTAGYISTGQLLSTSLGLTQFMSSFIDPTELTSTVIGLGTQGFVSSLGLTYAVASTAQGLGTFGYTSTSQLLSTSLGLYQQIQTSATAIVQADVTSTTIGLGTFGYLSTVVWGSVVSTANLANLVSTANLANHVSTANLANHVSTANLANLVSTANLANLVSTANLANLVSTANLANIVSTANLANLVSTANLANLVSTANLANLVSTANLANLVSTANLANLVSTSALNSIITSTIIGLGTAGYVSTLLQASFMRGSRSSGQTTNITVGCNVVFTQVDISAGTDISLNTGTGVITLAPNRIYRLIGSVPNAQMTAGNLAMQWSNIGVGLVGSLQSYYSPTNGAAYAASGSESEYIFSPSVTTNVAFIVINNSSVSQLGGNSDFSAPGSYPWFEIQVIGGLAPYVGPVLTNIVSTSLLNYAITSTVIGLGTAGYLSSATSAVIPNGIISTANLANLVSTSFLNSALTSTVIGLGTAGYLSSGLTNIGGYGIVSTANLTNLVSTANLANLVSTANLANLLSTANLANLVSTANLANLISTANLTNLVSTANLTNLVSTANLANLVSTSYLANQLASTVIGLGTAGYLSSQTTVTLGGLVSTSYLSTQLGSTFTILNVSSLSTFSFVGTTGFISSLTVNNLYIGSNQGFTTMGDVIGTSISTILLYTGQEYATNIYASSLVVSSIISYSNQVSIISNLQLNVSSINGVTLGGILGSTVIGLGTAGYISTGQLLSTSLGLTQYKFY